MKKLSTILLMALVSTSAFAKDCSKVAKSVAKMNLAQVARKYGFDSANMGVGAATLIRTKKVKITEKTLETLSVFEVGGYIYKASYTAKVTLDESCAIRNVSIQDDYSANL